MEVIRKENDELKKALGEGTVRRPLCSQMLTNEKAPTFVRFFLLSPRDSKPIAAPQHRPPGANLLIRNQML
ncbi:hypothetical protein [Dyadobacter psychrotolerans]|uniref:Uncharacterized protein n=1 Tax=Dyadobacter psychrotolerans TaxID=2541721 RepID=A0A4R5DEU9_9BACT|nr:hypothetical protein [Dyadobacter psychrotolerans]TDE12309.1 hypothetical protein E0F88_21630 [Dyadobacter psychrotolerans]